MPQVAESKSGSYRYCTLRYVTDWERQIEVPVGVAIWSADPPSFRIKAAVRGDQIEDLVLADAMPHIQGFQTELENWVATNDLPYSAESIPVLTDKWWGHVRKLLRFRVRLDEPEPIDCIDPAVEIDALFDAAIKPRQSRRQRLGRLETYVREALGKPLAQRLQSRTTVIGFRYKPVTVLKAIKRNGRCLVVEAVNLAARHAEPDADALASRLLRIKEGPYGSQTSLAIGYVASPGGLNGEAHMKEWLEKKSGCKPCDLVREAEEFRRQVVDNLKQLDPQAEMGV